MLWGGVGAAGPPSALVLCDRTPASHVVVRVHHARDDHQIGAVHHL